MKVVHSEHSLGEMQLRYLLDTETERLGMQIVPTKLMGSVVDNRETLNDTFEVKNLGIDCPAWSVDPLVHICLTGDRYGGGFAQGRTLRNSGTDENVRFRDQRVYVKGERTSIETVLEVPGKLEIVHIVSRESSEPWLRIRTGVTNTGADDIVLQNLSSFSLGHLSPFDADDSAGNLKIHRLQSYWSAEGRLRSDMAEELDLIPSWSGHGVRCERFGQVGSMPVRGWFPFAAIEDVKRKVFWGAVLEWSGSWQMELYRRDDYLSLSGGLADREFGHWLKRIKPGTSFDTPSAIVSTVQGNLDDLFYALTRSQEFSPVETPSVERDLPIVVNEWCTSWGNPNHQDLAAMADRLKDTPAKYLVIDAGWYSQPGKNWESGNGDWIVSQKLFPHGMKKAADDIRARGLIPGIWFEMETIGTEADSMSMTDLQLHRDGVPITSGPKRFWDFRNADAVRLLQERVTDFIVSNGFGYLKVDYNETIGIGVDGAESLGEGLRQHIASVHGFWRSLQDEIPELVIENCSSGGHRLEPVMIGLSAMSSFSDAHEGLEIPVIAANVARMILPRKSQIWAVLRREDRPERLFYSLSATFLGRMCLSGDLCGLDDAQWNILLKGMHFYQDVRHIIADGKTSLLRTEIPNYRHLTGWQCVLRESSDAGELLAVVHTFPTSPKTLEIELPLRNGEIVGVFARNQNSISLTGRTLVFQDVAEFTGAVVHIRAAGSVF